MNKIKVIIKKEWAEVFKNRMVVFTVAFLPLIMTAIPLIVLFASRDVGAAGSMDTDHCPRSRNRHLQRKFSQNF